MYKAPKINSELYTLYSIIINYTVLPLNPDST